VRENVHAFESREVEADAIGQIGEGGAGERGSSLALEHCVELLAQAMQIEHVRGGVGELRLAQGIRAPVRRLLLLGDLHAQKLARQILEPVPVGVGPRDLRGDLGAIDGRRHDSERMMEHAHVEAAVVEELHDPRIGQQALEVGRASLPGADLHDIRRPVAARHLHHAEPVAADGEPQRLSIDGCRLAKRGFGGQVVSVKSDHRAARFDPVHGDATGSTTSR